jgi:hypothetical protein
MKKVYRHTPLEKTAPKPRKKVVAKPKKQTTLSDEELYSHPLFHTRYQGMPYTYIRPLDPVWPSEPES